MRSLICIIISCAISIYCLSCGDMLSKKIKISDNYYLLENEFQGGLSLYFKSAQDDFVQRVPESVVEYGIDDNFIITKCKVEDTFKFFIIDRKKDFHFAEPKDYLTGPLNVSQYDSISLSRNLFIKFIKIYPPRFVQASAFATPQAQDKSY